MLFVIQFFVCCLGGLMFLLPMKHKLAILVFSFICLDAVPIGISIFNSSENLLSSCFFISELPKIFVHIKRMRRTLLLKLMLLMTVATIVLLVYSPHYHKATGVVSLILQELIFKYFAVVYGFLCVKNKIDLKPTINIAFVGMLLLTFWGIVNLMVRSSPWLDIVQIKETEIALSDYETSDRFRVQSMFANPFCYGYVCTLCFLFFMYAKKIRLISKTGLWIVGFCSLFGAIACACRTLWVLFFIGIIIYYSVYLSKRNIFKMGIAIVLLCLGIFMAMPERLKSGLTEKFTSAISTNTSMLAEGGSSIGMRIVQTTAVLYYIDGHYMFGRGRDFFLIDMGWGDNGKKSLLDKDLWGLEGIYMNLLLERGIFGLLCWIVFCFSIFLFFFKHRKIYKDESALAISIVSIYVLFACMTGELNSALPSFLVLGMMLKMIALEEQPNKLIVEKKKICKDEV